MTEMLVKPGQTPVTLPATAAVQPKLLDHVWAALEPLL